MTGKRISAEQVRVMAVFMAEPQSWFNSNAIERKTEIPGSSIRHFLLAFLRLGLVERLEVHGGYRYRVSPEAERHPYFQRLQEAAAAMRP